MKAFLLTLYPFIVASFVGCFPPGGGFLGLVSQPKNLAEQLDILQEVGGLFLNDKEGHCEELQHHFEEHGVGGFFGGYCEDIVGLFEGAVELYELLVKPHAGGQPEVPGGHEDRLLHHVGAVFPFLQGMRRNLVRLLHELEGDLPEGLHVNDEEVAPFFVDHGFPVELLADVPVQDVHEMLEGFLAEGQPLDKVLHGHGVGLTLVQPRKLGDKVLWLHEFALAVANKPPFEQALLGEFHDVPFGPQVVEVLKELAGADGMLHKAVEMNRVSANIILGGRELHFEDFGEGYVGHYLQLLKQFLGGFRPEILKIALLFKECCPAQAGRDFPVEFLESGEFHAVEVPCQAGKFVAVDGPLGKLEALLNEEAQ
ncbi:hypothetical protein BgAZ_102550 [Babesia gibsoni]|uniref:Uncharacterized protein n=1 Tax=Babesia gibsoni TaxID=33632 RepID=A0AAD8PFJ5_BABGI|nr:hypothetical protein BgAZ_102550 [Babesia gibsoni]